MGHVFKGMLLVLAASYLLLKRRETPDQVPGMKKFQDYLGDRAGALVHLLVTSLLPLLVGLWAIADGLGLLRSFDSQASEPAAIEDPTWTPERAAKFQADLAKARREGDGGHAER